MQTGHEKQLWILVTLFYCFARAVIHQYTNRASPMSCLGQSTAHIVDRAPKTRRETLLSKRG